jgi:ribosome-associated protein
MIVIGRNLQIHAHEITFVFSRSSKPGGQKVNKTSSRVTLHFDVEKSVSLSEAQRTQIREKLASRISKDGILRVVSQKHRTQTANREAALERFKELLRTALKRRRRRKPTAVPQEVTEQRLRYKKHRSRLKRERTRPSAAEA